MRIVLSLMAILLLCAGPARADIAPPYPEFHAGLQISEAEPFPKVNDIVKGSPADKAGVKLGDFVIALNGNYSKWKGPFYFWAKGLRGPKDSKVNLIVLRDEALVLVFDIPRTIRVR